MFRVSFGVMFERSLKEALVVQVMVETLMVHLRTWLVPLRTFVWVLMYIVMLG